MGTLLTNVSYLSDLLLGLMILAVAFGGYRERKRRRGGVDLPTYILLVVASLVPLTLIFHALTGLPQMEFVGRSYSLLRILLGVGLPLLASPMLYKRARQRQGDRLGLVLAILVALLGVAVVGIELYFASIG